MKDVELKIDIPDKILFVDMDAKLIEQVLINLIDNAIKYCKTECKINIKVYEEEEYVAFEVIDNGPGICEEFIDSVLIDFYRRNKS